MVILITGTSRGIGFELVKKLCNDHLIIAVSRSAMHFSHPNVHFIQGDIYDESTIHQCKDYLQRNQQCLDILINNAGILINKPFEKITKDELEKVYQTNVFGVFYFIQQMLPFLSKSKKSHIVNISSMGGINGTQKFPGLSVYSSSKGAVSILTECLAEELKTYSISCNALALGAVQTEMLSAAFPDFKAPLSPSEMADFVVWFALNGHQFFNGKILPVAISTP
jgi:NAD(P)-dependent dehydrogenase (short-subunit alcohol dehydrogenase family)